MGTLRPSRGIALYFACIDLPFVLSQAPISLALAKNGKGCGGSKAAMAAFAHTHPLN